MGIYSVVEFEVLEPATVNFPDHVNQLLILNRALFTFDVFNEEDREGMEAEHLTIIDTLITNTTFRGMQEVLRESPIDRFHTPLWVSERRTDTALLDDLILTKREVETICSTYKVNALISLEYYSMDINERIVHYSDAPSMVQHHYYEVSNNLKWNIHLPESPTPFDSYSTADPIYFTDIQGIVARKTFGGKIQNAILGGFILLFGLMALFNNSGMIIFHGIFTGIMIAALLINIYKGPSCETHLFTAVQTEKLTTLNRLKIAIRIMERLRPLIEHSQRQPKPARRI